MGERTCAELVAERDQWADTARSEMAGRRAAEAEIERLMATEIPLVPAELIGRIAPVRIDAAARMSLAGTLVAETQTA
jgi:hypothetical protein